MRANRIRRGAAVALFVALALYGAAQIAVSLPSSRAALQARLERELRERLGGEVTLGPGVEVDWAFRVAFGPVELRPSTAKPPGAAGGAPHRGTEAPAASPATVRVERVKARASGIALLAGRLEPASIRLAGVRVNPGPRGRSLRALVASARSRTGDDAPALDASRASGRAEAAPAAAEPARTRTRTGGPSAPRALPRVHARGVVIVAELRERTFELGPLDVDASSRAGADGERAELAILFPRGGRAAAELARSGSPGDGGAAWRLRVRAEALGPDDLPAALRTLPARLEAGAISLELEAEAPAALDRAEGRLRVVGAGLFVSGERIAEEPLGPLHADVRGTVRWDGTERRLSLSEGALVLAGGALPLDIGGEIRLGASFPFALAVSAAGVDHAAVVAALPPALAPPPEAPRPQGTFDARLEVSGPALAPAAWSVAAALDVSRMREASRKLRPQPLREPFVHVPQQPARSATLRAPGFLVGPGNPDFVPVADLPEHVVRAVTASEDGGFFAHHGFDFAELGLAFAAGAERGRVVRGGSTITQQVAKNLYLGREKTLARKVREAAITLALEACLPKARLLEIYLNVAEWGPGIHGIGPAARHWFGKDARALTPREAAFLASVIPNPVRYDAMRTRGVSPGWESRVDELLLKMNEQGALSEDDLLRALGEPIVFTGG